MSIQTPEWVNTEEGEQSPFTPPPSADRPQDDAGNLLGHSTQEGSEHLLRLPHQPLCQGGQQMQTRVSKSPLHQNSHGRTRDLTASPSCSTRSSNNCTGGSALSSHPRVYGGRVIQAWKIQSKLAYRAQRRLRRQQGTWGKDKGTASSSGKR